MKHSRLKRKPYKIRRKGRNPQRTLKTKLWTLLSRYIRDRDNWTCFTCDKQEHSPNMHSGHFIQQGGHANTEFDPRNIHSQCSGCNLFRHGNLIEYTLRMENKYGRRVVMLLREKARHTKNWDTKDLQTLIDTLELNPEAYPDIYLKVNPD